MLHLIFQSPIVSAVLDRIESGDDVVFLESAVFQLNCDGVFSRKINELLDENIFLYVLQEELETRGIEVNERVSIIDYPGLVELTEKNKVIKTWS